MELTLRCTAFFLATCIFHSIVWAAEGEFSKAVRAYKANDYFMAKEVFKHLAANGEAPSQRYLGDMYDKGLGMRQNYERAVHWYRKAAEQSDPIAQFRLALKYANGQGVKKDPQQAYVWFALAYENGHQPAVEPLLVLKRTMSLDERQDALRMAEKLKLDLAKATPQ